MTKKQSLELTLEREIKDMDRQIKEARRTATTALSREDKLAGQKRIKALEGQRPQDIRRHFKGESREMKNLPKAPEKPGQMDLIQPRGNTRNIKMKAPVFETHITINTLRSLRPFAANEFRPICREERKDDENHRRTLRYRP